MYYHNFWGNPHMFSYGFSGILNILFWLFIVFIFYRLIKNSKMHGFGDSSKGPVDILKERYAKGEINKEQFESMKKDLEK